jgi:hypothetical protein
VRGAAGCAAALAIAGGLLAACGNKTPLRPPEAVQPRPATSLVASSAKEGVVLTWRRPTEYTGGARMTDLGGFEIERAPAEGPADFARIGRLELDDQKRFRPQRELTWTDTTAVAGTRYRYRVFAFTLDDYQSAAAGPVTVLFDPTKAPPVPSK